MTLTNVIITAYCAGSICANGLKPTPGVTIAGPRWVPLGSVVEVQGHRYIVQDRMNKRFKDRWDIFMRSRGECVSFGKQTNNVTIVELKKKGK